MTGQPPEEREAPEAGATAGIAEDGTPISAEKLGDLYDAVPGARGESPLQIPPKAWWSILKRVYVMTGFHNLSLLSAGVAFFAFLAFVPLIASVVLVYGLVGDAGSVTDNIRMLSGLVPSEVLNILEQQLLSIVTTSKATQGLGLLLALFFSLYGAMRSATAMIAALNIIYEEHETRSIIRTTGVAASITAGMVGVALVGIISVSLFTYARNFLSPLIGDAAAVMIQLATWVVAGALISVTFAMFFRYAPDRRAARWRWLSVGSILATVLWLLITLLFGFYVSNVTNYNATYGSLSAVVVFLMWLFLSAYAVLLGAEVNSETERQTMVDSTVGPERPIGLRGAVMADSVVVDRASRILLDKKHRREASNKAKHAS